MVREVHLDDAPNMERLLLEPIAGASTHVKIINAPRLKVLGYFDVGLHQLKIGSTVIKVAGCFLWQLLAVFHNYVKLHLCNCFFFCVVGWDKGEAKCNGSDPQDIGVEGAVWCRGASETGAPVA